MSGSQKFIVDLAIRLCLVKNHPYLPNFIILDEGFGCMDIEHLADTKEFISSLNRCTDMKFIMIISHIEELHHVAETNIPILIKDEKSFISKGDDSQISDTLKLTESNIETDRSVIVDVETPNEEGGYKCIICNKTLSTEGFLRRHMGSKYHAERVQKCARLKK
jgi:energy-coupling factor transporter ATP-binding protein EcfA2